MQLLKPLLALVYSLLQVAQVVSDYNFQCIVNALENGSVSYTLNDTISTDWTTQWTKNGTVIVSEEGEMHTDYIVHPVKDGYILRECYNMVLCTIEYPRKGISKNIPCTGDCNISANTSVNGISPINIVICMGICVGICVILFLIGFLVCPSCQSRRSVNSTDVEMQRVQMISDQT
ncbi:hypothetical protein Q7C36_007175 [Tachysurus vachellii]|uniref:Uncharacterized protein n=1 Tax=Tachysurus vachellii TaxID=175792 RepID=A0AA88T690_TACVA|nr:hypothetical protein Q7C36_007175 [Tachysurus vachellii]